MYKVYVIYSKKAGKYYTGQTEDLKRRLNEHNEGTHGKYTKNKGPWELLYFEEFKTREEALRREKYLKTGAGRDFVQSKLKN
jgi:putative endonuclease